MNNLFETIKLYEDFNLLKPKFFGRKSSLTDVCLKILTMIFLSFKVRIVAVNQF